MTNITSQDKLNQLTEILKKINFYLVIGKAEHMRSLEDLGLWGLPARYERTYLELKEGDFIFFYAPYPYKELKYIGILKNKGILTNDKDVAEKYWLNPSKYPLRFIVDVKKIKPPISLNEMKNIWNEFYPNKQLKLQGSIFRLPEDFALALLIKLKSRI